MDSLNLPMHLAQFAGWEYAELSLSGGVTQQVQITKSGIVPVKQVSDTNYVSLADPARAGIEITVVMSDYTAGTLRIQSSSGNVYLKASDGSVSAQAYAQPGNLDGFVYRFVSVPIYIGGVRTYRWYTDTLSM